MSCERCGSFAINHAAHGRDGSDPELCDVCYWRKRTEAKDAELAGYVEANRHMKGELDDALEDARKYCEAQGEIARLREALGTFMEWWDTESAGPQYSSPLGRDGFDGEREWRAWWDNQLRLAALAPELGRAALAQVAEVGNG